jgi:hypothetical protein
MAGRTFALIVVDRDSSEFTVEGPMSDDRPWNRAVVDAQKAGRDVRCFSMGDITPGAAAAEWQAAHGGQRVAPGSIIGPARYFVRMTRQNSICPADATKRCIWLVLVMSSTTRFARVVYSANGLLGGENSMDNGIELGRPYVAQIVASYLRYHKIDASEIPPLIAKMRQSLA